MKLITILVVALLLTACSQPSKRKPLNPDDISFSDYLKSLDTIPLPFSQACSGPGFMNLSTHFDTTGFKKYKDKDSSRPLGVLFNDDNNIVLVNLVSADYCVAPVIISFDKKGNKLDDLDVYGHSYMDTASSSMPYFKVTKDKRIVVIDTVKNWQLDTASNIVPGSEIKNVDSTIYELLKNGKFIKVTQKK